MISVLFTEIPSIYDTLDVDTWNKERNALNWPGGNPVIAHPPCRAWSQLSPFAKPPPGERRLAIWSVLQIRRNGGVLEHPARSKLWPTMNLPGPFEEPDEFGGWTLPIDQNWWGHKARKRTFLYICGCRKKDIPEIPLSISMPTHTMGLYSSRDKKKCRPDIPKKERASTPLDFAIWLIDLAKRCKGTIHA